MKYASLGNFEEITDILTIRSEIRKGWQTMHSSSNDLSHMGVANAARLGSSVRSIRKGKKMTQHELSERAGVSLFCLRDLENSIRSIGTQNVFKVLAALDYSISLHPYPSGQQRSGGGESPQVR